MELSQSRSDRDSATQKESLGLSPTQRIAWLTGTLQGTPWKTAAQTVQQASQLRVWLDGMQEQLQKTAIALRTDPSTVISLFQKTLSRPSYFYAPAESTDWLILLGPKPLRPVTLRSWRPADDLKIQVRRLVTRFLHQGFRIHAQLNVLSVPVTPLRTVEILRHHQQSRRLARRARLHQTRVLRVQAILMALQKRGSSELQGPVQMYTRMLTLQAQRFHAIRQSATETSKSLRLYYRRRRRRDAVNAQPARPVPALRQVTAHRSSGVVNFRGTIQFLHQWLMHPLIDTRDPSEPV